MSDTRTLETDGSGDLIAQLLSDAGHVVVDRSLIADNPGQIEATLRGTIDAGRARAILTTGGTGIGPRDNTISIVRRLLDDELPGFGELFRMLSYEQIGAAAMLSRAIGGLTRRVGDRPDVLIFAMPGSPKAVELAMRSLIVPQLPHLISQLDSPPQG